MEDRLWEQKHEVHWPFFAGGIDVCCNLTYSHIHREKFMGMDSINDSYELLSKSEKVKPTIVHSLTELSGNDEMDINKRD